MKKLLTLLLLFPLFIGCSSDDDNQDEINRELEKKLVGQWSDAYKGDWRGTLYRFYDNNTFQKYDVQNYKSNPRTIKKNKNTDSSFGTFKIEGNFIIANTTSKFQFAFENDTIIRSSLTGTLHKDLYEDYAEAE